MLRFTRRTAAAAPGAASRTAGPVRSTLFAGLLVALVLTRPPGLVAQEALAAPGAAADTVRLEELLVTVYRIPVPAAAVTAEVEVISGEELEARGIDYVGEAIRRLPGAAVVQSGSFGSLTSLFLRGGESDHVKVLVDGVPLNQPGGSFDFGSLRAENLERIEVLRGPASVVHGSDAMSGVVQLFTRRGSGAPRIEGEARGGSFGTLALDGALSGGGESGSYSFSLSHYATDGTLDFNNDYRNTTASGFARLEPDGRTRADLVVRYTDNAFHFPTDGAGALVDANQFREEELAAVGLEASRRFGDRVEAVVSAGLTEADAATIDAPDGPGDTLGFFAFRGQDDISRRRAGGRVNIRLTEGTVLTAGAEIEGQDFRSLSESEGEFGSSVDELEAERKNRGYYAQVVALIGDRLALNAGARIDDNEAFGTFDTYRLGAAYRLPTRTRVRATFGTGFKEPTFFENFSSGFAVGNPELEPERSRSWELGVEQPWLDERLRVSGTWFDQRFRDLVQFTFAPTVPGGPNFFNVAEARAAGVELEAEVRPGAGVELSAAYTWLDTEVLDAGFDSGEGATFVEGEPLIRRPEHSLAFVAGWSRPGIGGVHLALARVGERHDRDFSTFPAEPVVLPAYTRVDVALRLDFLSTGSRWSLTPVLRIDNLLDERYEEVRNFPAPGRTVLAGLRFGLGPESGSRRSTE